MSETRPDVIINHAPTDEELAAIVAALEFITTAETPAPSVPPPSRWATVARREVMRGSLERDTP
jgi:hypothetical protein